MKTQDPIEKRLKQRLDGVQKSTEVPTWAAVSQSLKKRKDRKNLILFWSSIGLFAVMAVLFFPSVGKNSESPLSPQDNSEQTVVQEAASTKASEEHTDTTATEERTVLGTENALTKDLNTTISNTDPNVVDDFTKGAEIKPTYYYYDSETGRQISTDDPGVIDSLLQRETPLKLKDSL